MDPEEFYEFQKFKIQRQVIQDVEKAVVTACDTVMDIHESPHST